MRESRFLWYILFWFVLKVPQFWKKRESRNSLLKMNGLIYIFIRGLLNDCVFQSSLNFVDLKCQLVLSVSIREHLYDCRTFQPQAFQPQTFHTYMNFSTLWFKNSWLKSLMEMSGVEAWCWKVRCRNVLQPHKHTYIIY